MLGCSQLRLAARNQIRSRATDCILYDVRQEGCEENAYKEAQDRDVGFVKAGPRDCGPEYNEDQRSYTAIYDQFPARDTLD